MNTLTRKVFIFIISVLFFGWFCINAGNVLATPTNLSWGSRGEEVVQLQQALNTKGYTCGQTDGIFGSQTHSAVVRLQKDCGLTADGIVGPLTRSALGQSSIANSSRARETTSVSRGSSWVTTIKATGYCSCNKCNYPYGGKPSYLGYPLSRGIVAVDPQVIPLGRKLYIEGYGNGIAADTGGAIVGNRIDLCFSSHQEALNWGIRTVKVTVYQ